MPDVPIHPHTDPQAYIMPKDSGITAARAHTSLQSHLIELLPGKGATGWARQSTEGGIEFEIRYPLPAGLGQGEIACHPHIIPDEAGITDADFKAAVVEAVRACQRQEAERRELLRQSDSAEVPA